MAKKNHDTPTTPEDVRKRIFAFKAFTSGLTKYFPQHPALSDTESNIYPVVQALFQQKMTVALEEKNEAGVAKKSKESEKNHEKLSGLESDLSKAMRARGIEGNYQTLIRLMDHVVNKVAHMDSEILEREVFDRKSSAEEARQGGWVESVVPNQSSNKRGRQGGGPKK